MGEFTGGEYLDVPPVPQVIGDEVPPGRLPNENTANTSSLEWREVSGTSDPVVSSERYQVTFAPQLRGTLASARSPRLDLQTPGHQNTPGCPQPLVSLARTHRSFFLLQPMRLSIPETVESLTETPHTRHRNSRLWERVTSR